MEEKKYEFVLRIKTFNTANYSYVMEKLRDLMNDDVFIFDHSSLEIIPKREEVE